MSCTPKVTIALFCYNQKKYIRQALESCLSQDYPNLKVVVSDDVSSDGTIHIIEEILGGYTGRHEVVFNQNSQNLGIGRHFAFVMDNLVDGELVVMCAGDDISKPTRVSRVVQEWLKAGKPSLVANGLEELDGDGLVVNGQVAFQYEFQDYSVHSNQMYSLIEYHKYNFAIHFLGAAVAYRIDTYRVFGTPVTFPDCEDHLMYFRALLADGVHYFPEVLTGYRKHEEGWTSQLVRPLHPLNMSSPLLSNFLDKKGGFREEYFNAFAMHQIVAQQWHDYLLAVRSGKVVVDFQLVQSMWGTLRRRHENLVRNKEVWDARIDYVSPLNSVIFGTGQGARNTMRKLGAGFKVMYACNTDADLRGQIFCGLEVIDLLRLAEIKGDIDCVLVASSYFFKIKKMLVEQAGLSLSKIIRLPVSVVLGDTD